MGNYTIRSSAKKWK